MADNDAHDHTVVGTPIDLDKMRSIQVAAGGIRRDRTVREAVQDGHKVKHTTEGDPVNGSVTHTEHANSDRVDCNVAPAPVSISVSAMQGS